MANPKVLIVDDDPAARHAVAEDLKREGYDLLFAENGREGLGALWESSPSVVILDLRMPVMDGLEFLQNIELSPAQPYSVIVLTGHGDSKAVKECYDAGVTMFIKKPFNLYEVRGVVKNALAVKQLTIGLDEMVSQRTADLEQRVREINALNQVAQSVLEQATALGDEYQTISDGLQTLADDAAALAERARSVSEKARAGGVDSGSH